MRHGESTWNASNTFTGWTDIPLSDVGEYDARCAGQMLKERGFNFDCVYTSMLVRSLDTAKLMLEELGQQNTHIH